MNITNIKLLGTIAFAIGLAGCATSNLPRGARLVGGGLQVEYTAPRAGTAILIERTSGRIVASESLGEGDSFDFHPFVAGYDEILFRMFGDTSAAPDGSMVAIPTNALLQLYFVPEKTKKE
jgi:hypothetical protein